MRRFKSLYLSFFIIGFSCLLLGQDYLPEKMKARNKELLEYYHKYKNGYGSISFNPYTQQSPYALVDRYLRYAQPLEKEYTIDGLLKTIKSKKLKTIESVINELPPEMKNQDYVLMYRSRSLQEATPEAPRAILYTPTASLILSFNGGDKNKKGSNTIEAIQFRRDQKKFEFHEITFDNIHTGSSSGPNPSKCLECHQSPTRKTVDMRPNWEPYSTWIGAFGSATGDFSSTPLKDRYDIVKRILPQDVAALAEQASEFDFFKRYINDIAPSHPRYKLLGKFNLNAPTDLTEHLSILNFQRVARLISEEKNIYPLYKEALALLTKCFYDSETMLNIPAMKWHFSFSYPQYYDFSPSQSHLHNVSSFLTTLFEPLGVDTSDWSMDFGTGGRFALQERFGTPSNPAEMFRYAWYNVLPDSAELNQLSCQKLNDIASTKLTEAFQKGVQQKIREERLVPLPQPQDIANRCARCHADRASGAPQISFNHPSLLARELGEFNLNSGTLFEEVLYRTSDMAPQAIQMPPAHRLSAGERNIFIQYLKELQK